MPPRRHRGMLAPTWRVAVRVASTLALIASLMALYAKLYFWDGTRYAPLYVDFAIWSFIVAGPLAVWLSVKRAHVALVPITAQLIVFRLATWA